MRNGTWRFRTRKLSGAAEVELTQSKTKSCPQCGARLRPIWVMRDERRRKRWVCPVEELEERGEVYRRASVHDGRVKGFSGATTA